ncbi:uncharacterized protein LOC142179096 [Nicotiana tabacum]|uniref:Uncharacterized protein LOC142179096 n=1 Tax=Nicotiana tabacum TaxID=4097 RepID=A0AC58U6Q3_TOBAC
MTSLTVLLRHSGKWNGESNYVEYSIEGILIKEYASYNDLVESISNQLGIDLSSKSIKIQYKVEGNSTPMEIHNDMGYRVYVELKKENREFGIYALLCMSEDCEWRFKASSINKSELLKVREFIDNHTCPLKKKVYEQRQTSSSLIGGMIKPKLANHKRKYTPKDIIDDVKSDLGVYVSYMLAWRAKEKAMNFLRGEPADSYKKLPGYLYTMDMTYPGHILPLAYGVIDSENDAAWTWFFEQFKIAYGDRENTCIVSDRNESIIKSVPRVYPDVPHFACIWHLWNNSDGEGEKVDIRVKEYLELAGYEKWARFYAPVNRGWTMTSNIAESINAALVSARELPIYDFLEEVRKMFGRWNCSNRKEATQTYTMLGKKYQEMLTLNEAMSTRITSKFLMPEEYCSNYYKPNTVVMTYDVPVYPLPDRNDWNIPAHVAEEVVLPPKWKRPPGRPKKKRDKPLSELMQPKNQHSCSICGQGGHNKQTCINAPHRI